MIKLRGKLLKDVALARFNTWRVGGIAKQVYKPADIEDLCLFLSNLPASDDPIWLGLGSNILFPDEDISSTVILTQGGLQNLTLLNSDDFRAEAGVTCAKAAKFCVKNNFIDAEFFAGIPGTIGGALAMNAGAFGHETWEFVSAVETIDRQGNLYTRDANEYQISYRSVFGPKEWFVAAHFKLPRGDGKATANNIKALLKKRNAMQPIGLPSCGSVFTNPPGDYAARLIEMCDLKGYSIGGAEVSVKHANFIINKGNATAADIIAIIEHIQQTVYQQQHIKLEPEVKNFTHR